MRKTFLFMMVSADGYFEGVNNDISWHNTDDEFNDFATEQLDEADTLVFGRKTYELMASYWPTTAGTNDDPETAARMNSYEKIVFSKTPLKTDWENVQAYKDDVVSVISTLKQQAGKNIAVLASSNLCLTLIREGLLEEVRLMVNPVVLGKGTSLFTGLACRLDLTLVSSRTFRNGNVLLTYNVIK